MKAARGRRESKVSACDPTRDIFQIDLTAQVSATSGIQTTEGAFTASLLPAPVKTNASPLIFPEIG